MQTIPQNDRAVLRELAQRWLALAHSPENDAILRKWDALAHGRRETPTVRLLFSNFTDEVITPRMRCQSEAARSMEFGLLWGMVGRELFGDDTPILPYYDVSWNTWADPFGVKPHLARPDVASPKGFHIHPVITDLSTQLEQLKHGSFGADREATRARITLAQDVFGDLLPVRMVQGSLTAPITNPLVMLMGMENYLLAMYDTPDELHELMDTTTRLYEDYYDFLEREKLLLPARDTSFVAQESFAFNSELPTENVTSTKQLWGFLESQETTGVSPAMYGEFVWPYQDRLVRRYGLLSYGCCERVDALWEDYLSKWKNLRKLSVSPFNNEPQIGEYLRGSNVVYYSKPRAEFVTNPGPLDENALREYFKGVCKAASGCLFEMAQREVGTIFGDFERGRRYVQIAKECIEDHWQP
ncbi:MAG: hypothetical protein IJ412_09905 [Oscillospiraceae bacterium]|nr:hypothetical protein [Oscillospiraceae bacterium]